MTYEELKKDYFAALDAGNETEAKKVMAAVHGKYHDALIKDIDSYITEETWKQAEEAQDE